LPRCWTSSPRAKAVGDRRRRIAEVIAWQAGEGRERSVSAMAADYEALYGEVTRRRRAWPDAQA